MHDYTKQNKCGMQQGGKSPKTQYYTKTRMLLWKALIRSILTYALQTQTYQKGEIGKLEQFQFGCLRRIENEKWPYNKNQPGKNYT